MMDQLDFGDITAVYTVDRNGDLTDMAMTFSLEMTVPCRGGVARPPPWTSATIWT